MTHKLYFLKNTRTKIFFLIQFVMACQNSTVTVPPPPETSPSPTSAPAADHDTLTEKSDNAAKTDKETSSEAKNLAESEMPKPDSSLTSTDSKDEQNAKPAIVAKSSAADEAEKAARAATAKQGVRPVNSRMEYLSSDIPRIQNYKLFIDGSIDNQELIRRLFKDSDFNRSVLVLANLYERDKNEHQLTPETDLKFQELGQKLGNEVLIYNRKKQQEQNATVGKATLIGTLLGATAGGLLLEEDWIPLVVRTRLGPRIPAYIRNPVLGALVGGAAGGGALLLTTESYYVINRLANPNSVFNADPLLDTPSVK